MRHTKNKTENSRSDIEASLCGGYGIEGRGEQYENDCWLRLNLSCDFQDKLYSYGICGGTSGRSEAVSPVEYKIYEL